ncbi:MAG: GNAT family N-acetyltransferase, partial [Caldilineae bacterium]
MDQAGITIRRADEKDVPIIVELNYALFQEDAGQRDPFMNLNWPREEGHQYFSKLL